MGSVSYWEVTKLKDSQKLKIKSLLEAARYSTNIMTYRVKRPEMTDNQPHICSQNIVASVLANRVVYGSLSYLVFGLNPRVYRHTSQSGKQRVHVNGTSCFCQCFR